MLIRHACVILGLLRGVRGLIFKLSRCWHFWTTSWNLWLSASRTLCGRSRDLFEGSWTYPCFCEWLSLWFKGPKILKILVEPCIQNLPNTCFDSTNTGWCCKPLFTPKPFWNMLKNHRSRVCRLGIPNAITFRSTKRYIFHGIRNPRLCVELNSVVH